MYGFMDSLYVMRIRVEIGETDLSRDSNNNNLRNSESHCGREKSRYRRKRAR
jgi:hypothetical protein